MDIDTKRCGLRHWLELLYDESIMEIFCIIDVDAAEVAQVAGRMVIKFVKILDEMLCCSIETQTKLVQRYTAAILTLIRCKGILQQ